LDPNTDLASRNKNFVDRSINWIAQKINLKTHTHVLDLGCGPGLYTTGFAKLGAKVTGIDVSTNSIKYAKEQAKEADLDIDYINGNYVTQDFNGKYDLITIIYCDYCVLNPQSRAILLDKIFSSLTEKGVFILDVLSNNHFDLIKEKHDFDYSDSEGFWSSKPHFLMESTYKYDKSRTILDKHTVIEKDHQFTIYNYLKCFELEEIIKELSDHGLHSVEYFSDISGTEFKKDAVNIALINRKRM
jgi:SAM-dependent methyltransferase